MQNFTQIIKANCESETLAKMQPWLFFFVNVYMSQTFV